MARAPAARVENIFSGEAKPNSLCWPEQLDLSQLRDYDNKSNPYGDNFDEAWTQTPTA
jgi:catalase (peroxidase I)